MWDGWHYLHLSQAGYGERDESCRFYPLFPMGILALAPLLGGSHLLAGLLFSNLASTAGFLIFYYCVYSKYGSGTANWSLIFLGAFPGALFYQAVYSESLFFLLLMAAWAWLELRLYNLVWLVAFLLPLARPTGVFLGLPILWYLARDKPLPIMKCFWRPLDSQSAKITGKLAEKRGFREEWTNLRYYALLLAPFLGWCCYLYLMWKWSGDPWIGFKTQLKCHSVGNIVNLPKFLISFFKVTRLHEFESSFLERVVFVLFCATLPMQWRTDRSFLVWAYVLGLLPAMSGELNSFTRYLAPAFPFFIALGRSLGNENRARQRWALLLVFISLHVVLLWRFLNFKWAG